MISNIAWIGERYLEMLDIMVDRANYQKIQSLFLRMMARITHWFAKFFNLDTKKRWYNSLSKVLQQDSYT